MTQIKNKILIVDDDSDSLLLIQTIIQRLGFYTLTAVNGLDAINIIKQESLKPDLIILDIFMPQMDGFETLTYIKKNFKDIPILILSAGGSDTLNKVKDLGAKYFVQKPINQNKLQKSIFEIINN